QNGEVLLARHDAVAKRFRAPARGGRSVGARVGGARVEGAGVEGARAIGPGGVRRVSMATGGRAGATGAAHRLRAARHEERGECNGESQDVSLDGWQNVENLTRHLDMVPTNHEVSVCARALGGRGGKRLREPGEIRPGRGGCDLRAARSAVLD